MGPRKAYLVVAVGLVAAALVAFLGSLVPLELPELAVPSRVYARPHRIASGQSLDTAGLLLFDPESVEVVTPPVVLVEGVLTNGASGIAHYAFSDNGTLAFVPGTRLDSSNRTLALVARDGTVDRLNLPPREYLSPRISPDGEKLDSNR